MLLPNALHFGGPELGGVFVVREHMCEAHFKVIGCKVLESELSGLGAQQFANFMSTLGFGVWGLARRKGLGLRCGRARPWFLRIREPSVSSTL